MFHRAVVPPNNKTSDNNVDRHMDNRGLEQAPNMMNKKNFRNRVESSAVERYAQSQEEMTKPTDLANQNVSAPVEVPQNQQMKTTAIHNEKEVSSMNNPEQQMKDNAPADDKKPAMAPQGRDVNIPGNNFQRPGQAGRPSYPGSYASNTAAANNPYAPQGASDNGRKLVIGQGITMSGEIESCEHLIVEGTIEATLKGASVLDVYESGAFLGTVEIEEANIAGRFEGDITVKGRLTIESTGQVVGSISYKELSMEAGAVIDGAVSPIGSANAAKNANTKTASKSKKATQNSGAELPFSDKVEAAE